MGWKIGVDIGGTFMDFCAVNTATNALHSFKVLTTPDQPGRELGDGLTALADDEGVELSTVETFVHGTTVGINTVIQRKGARLALLTNAGFEDVVELGRLRLPDMYSLFCAQPEPLVTRDMIFGVGGRMLSDGTEESPLDPAEVEAAVMAAKTAGAEGLVVSFLHSYRNAAHEHEVVRIARETVPDIFIFSSADVWPIVREYERTTTAILNGYIHPRIAGYLSGLEQTLEALDVPARPYVTKSNGGLMTAAEGKTSCVNMLLSGTASGVMGAAWLARQAGVSNVLTLDIGGTSADLALITDSTPAFGQGEQIGDFPMHMPSVSVSSIGIGGGSVAVVDEMGVLRVGPESAGSVPGPACYGRGGTRPTLTDAMVVCGYLGHAPMAYGQLEIDAARAHEAMAQIAEALDLTPEAAAQAIIEVAISEMFVEVEKLVSREGVDVRDYALLPFGGGGPMFGCFLASELGITEVLAPPRPGVVSALGGLVADLKGDFVRTLFLPCASDAAPALRDSLGALEAEGEAWLRERQGFTGETESQISADMRYHGQSFEIDVPLDQDWIAEGNIEAMRDAFHRRHEEIYDFADVDSAVELVNLRLVKAGRVPPLVMESASPVDGPAPQEKHITLRRGGAPESVPLHLRGALRAGQWFDGPAVVAQEDTTLVVPRDFHGRIDSHLNIHLTRRTRA
ncbi:hydantoinase/oxoprolinase family protein [Rhodovibrio salinarum]|uniref:Hydantoinase n=1 Tax=Rhodovibrio salinarum TaxID=1087 RepID=A0A934V384_9PROT|nr:hydantoinase/oxoprolinase family protein [Rhodovibrio salinarum]MBK1699164.1 hydantoinase [Rhodovibrio salinarum]